MTKEGKDKDTLMRGSDEKDIRGGKWKDSYLRARAKKKKKKKSRLLTVREEKKTRCLAPHEPTKKRTSKKGLELGGLKQSSVRPIPRQETEKSEGKISMLWNRIRQGTRKNSQGEGQGEMHFLPIAQSTSGPRGGSREARRGRLLGSGGGVW